jgi:DNA polymerase III subunit epsilon
MYAIIDIETTGGNATFHKITEVAIILHDGKEVLDRFETLINPGKYIPAKITLLTGITNEMVAQAPSFSEVADRILEITKDAVFVAHNVNFDYSFIKHEFAFIGKEFNRKKLCTVRLSRRIIPGLPSYSLGNLCSSVGIRIQNRHRAGGDADGTAKLFEVLLQRDKDDFIRYSLKRTSRETLLPPNLPREEFENLPESIGVYYFLDKKGKVVYVGKAINIKTRVISHFSGNTNTRTRQNFLNTIYNVAYEECGNELIALLLEAHEIKKHWPIYNRSLKRVTLNYGIYAYEDRNGYARFHIGNVGKHDKPLLTFQNFEGAHNYLLNKIREFDLCPKLCGLQPAEHECYDHSIGVCSGACIGKVDHETYNDNAERAIQSFSSTGSFAIVGKGRSVSENSLILVEKGRYLGFGYLDHQEQITDFDTAKNYIKSYYDNQDILSIINSHIRTARFKQMPNLRIYSH